MNATIIVEGKDVRLSTDEATIFTTGDFAGNVDMSLMTNPVPDLDQVVANLRIRVPGADTVYEVLGYERTPRGIDVTFHVPSLESATRVPASVVLVWTGAAVAELGPVVCRHGG